MTDYVIDPNGDVWATPCTCPRHVRTSDARDNRSGHEAKPVGNVVRDPELAARLGHRPPTRLQEAV